MAGIDLSKVYIIEGIVEKDPMTDQITIRTVDRDGKPISIDPLQCIAHYVGEEIRFILTPIATVQEIERMVGSEQDGMVVADPGTSKGSN